MCWVLIWFALYYLFKALFVLLVLGDRKRGDKKRGDRKIKFVCVCLLCISVYLSYPPFSHPPFSVLPIVSWYLCVAWEGWVSFSLQRQMSPNNEFSLLGECRLPVFHIFRLCCLILETSSCCLFLQKQLWAVFSPPPAYLGPSAHTHARVNASRYVSATLHRFTAIKSLYMIPCIFLPIQSIDHDYPTLCPNP